MLRIFNLIDPFLYVRKLKFNWFQEALPAIIGALGSIGGGLLNRDSNRGANQANINLAQSNLRFQREFAQHGVKWRVEDAKRAGIHPLAALGANVASPYPVTAGVQGEDYSWLQDIGQMIGNAFSTEEKINKENLRIIRAEADLKERERNIIMNKDRTTVTATSPWMVDSSQAAGQGAGLDGFSNGNAIVPDPAMVQPQIGQGGVKAGRNPFYQMVDLPNNEVQLYPERNMMELIQDWNPYAFIHIKDLVDIKSLDRKAKSKNDTDYTSPAARQWVEYLRSVRPVEKGYSYQYMGMLRFKRVKGKRSRFFYNSNTPNIKY